jgi:hypothetical protein
MRRGGGGGGKAELDVSQGGKWKLDPGLRWHGADGWLHVMRSRSASLDAPPLAWLP